MTKTLSHNALFFVYLSSSMGFFQSLLYLIVGADLVTQSSFANYFLAANLASLLGTAFLLRFYNIQQFRAAFVTGLFAYFTALLRVVLLYCILFPLTRALQGYYPFVLVLDLGASLLAASSLVLSPAGKNGWLKAAGVSSFLVASSALAGPTNRLNAGL